MTATETTEQPRRIVVAVDGSPASQQALVWAVRQAGLTGAVVQAVTAWHYPSSTGAYAIASDMDWPANAKAVQDIAVKEILGDDTGSLIRSAVEGQPVPGLL